MPRAWLVAVVALAACGGHPAPAPAAMPSNRAPISDRDGDGIPDPLDKCPDAPEDFDGFQDADGCPDPDNDQDGILDIDDKCPNDPGPPPSGCPTAAVGDRDGDDIYDPLDKCPDDPEDFDGFQDSDGCPDPDNDNDGVLDVDDACPNVPGPASNHGCPLP
jgi:OOP family OmpA-OmpF porin